uniref:receptor protein serine/threonine kinase n=1 Tax=Xiphophorus maculatus TaxID=8083 RepID=A0A3B5QA19_XIPMA
MTEETELIQLLINTFFVIVECLFMQICHQSLLQKRRCAFQVTNVKNHGYYAAGNVTGSVQLCENTGCCLAIYRITNGQWKVDTLACDRVKMLCSHKTCEEQSTFKENFTVCTCSTDMCNRNISLSPEPERPPETHHHALLDFIFIFTLQVLGRGHFATVYQGKQRGSVVAVKVYTANWKHQFINEKGVYELPLMKHERILQFLGTEWKPDDSSLLIVLQYAEHGSLHSFLCKHASSWMLSMRLCQSLSEGLSYLHSDLRSNDVHKPPVAHRDLTSSNVLVRADGTCVLCDFGSSTILRSCSGHRFWRNHSTTMTGHLQFCTLNYMSPEILEGSVNLSSSSFLLQGDIYALGLILWEIWMRCSDLFTGGAVPEHLLPYELELDADVTLERLILFVSEMDRRPSIPGNWEMLPQGLGLKELLTDCWDRDTDARLSAPCVVNRLMSL